MKAILQPVPKENQLLAALPQEEYERLLAHLEPCYLPKGKVLHEAGDPARYVCFPSSGMISLLSTTVDGETIEVGMVGREGMTGIPIILRVNKMPYRAVVQIPGHALLIQAHVLRDEFDRGGKLQHLLLCYTYLLFTQITQSAVCNRFHTIEERLARWLLVTRDQVQSDTLELTQEFISAMLGTPRSVVSATAGGLQKARIISYSRGIMTILDRRGLEDASCECYRIVRDEINRCFTP